MLKKLGLLFVATLLLWGGCKCCYHCEEPIPLCSLKEYPVTTYIQLIDAKTQQNLVGSNRPYHPDSVTFTTTYAGGKTEANLPIKMTNIGGNLGYVMVLNIDTNVLKGDFYLNKNQNGQFNASLQRYSNTCKYLPSISYQYKDAQTDTLVMVGNNGNTLRSEYVLVQIRK